MRRVATTVVLAILLPMCGCSVAAKRAVVERVARSVLHAVVHDEAPPLSAQKAAVAKPPSAAAVRPGCSRERSRLIERLFAGRLIAFVRCPAPSHRA